MKPALDNVYTPSVDDSVDDDNPETVQGGPSQAVPSQLASTSAEIDGNTDIPLYENDSHIWNGFQSAVERKNPRHPRLDDTMFYL